MDASDQELQQYLFDLQGYLVIHNVLGAAEVAELNRLIDAQRLPIWGILVHSRESQE